MEHLEQCETGIRQAPSPSGLEQPPVVQKIDLFVGSPFLMLELPFKQ